MTAETTTEARWLAASGPFTEVVRGVADWEAPTPCEGWSARDLLDHVITSQRDFAARQGREVPVFDGSRSQLSLQWIKHEAAMSALAGDETFIDETMDTATGPMSVGEALVHYYGFDLLVHRWDLARSQGRQESFTEEEMDRVEAVLDSFGDQAYQPGILAGPLQAPAGAGRQERLLARLGRRA
ncbi:TIGR03086 family metal-binding protein [Micrococcus sp.]|uniref:TIGR03086 family metal-binding protein n=1 Tax=Micrococcus sp. TaxID=1271 RepID=UPI002A91EAAC|nr:TIGR03086 family metal-binding protein [Micrococcus sp.]MDY6055057.1 TIGR03086 family metal-binding protein [Micrococcus sp.]